MKRDQLMAAGATPDQIRHRLRVHRLHQVHRGVYSITADPTGRARYRAAVYACGDGAVLSHRSAADLLGLRPTLTRAIDVTVPRGNGCRPAGLTVHGTRSLPPEDVTEVDGIPCTNWARTVVDNAGALGEREVDRMIERAMILRVFDLRVMRATLARARGRRGTGTVARLVARFGEVQPTRSELERRFLDLVRDCGLPRPVVNGRVEGREVDFHWPDAQLIVETDGRATHDTPYGWERDRQRDLELELAGWRVIRITWLQVTEQPERIAQLLRARLCDEHVDCNPA